MAPTVKGLSPRVRGNRAVHKARTVGIGSIPAHAGEPPAAAVARSPSVYPRACGGTSTVHVQPTVARNREGHNACIGLPCRAHRGICGVYPRACGGTRPRDERSSKLAALASGHGHGANPENRVREYYYNHFHRSIPARAGEPRRENRTVRLPGGSIPARAGEPPIGAFRRASGRGLSPRVRGNR